MTTPIPDPNGVPDPRLRVCDADREHTAGLLQRAHIDGRLTIAEFDQRVSAGYAARTLGDLDALTADLPSQPPAHQPPGRPAPTSVGRPDPCLLCLLLIICPPAGLIYWLATGRLAGAVR